MGARTGKEFVDKLNPSRRDVQIHGERVTKNLADHPALKGVVRSYAALYDLQHDDDLRATMTYESPSTGDPVGMSFLQPKSVQDVERRRAMMKTWADYSMGMLGRTADYLNSSLMAMA